MSRTATTRAIAANLAALQRALHEARSVAQQSHAAMQRDDQAAAAGALLPLQDMLREAQTLYDAVMALHRRGTP